MSVTLDEFPDFFRALYGHDPFPWQTRLARRVHDTGWPGCIDLPTASGKTACIDIAVFVLACQAERADNDRTVGRRIFFTVNRRVIVDEAYERARRIAQDLLDAEGAPHILGDVARALRSLNAEQDRAKVPPLDVAQLRGGIYRDRSWARSLTQPTIICTTADQLGSRLLFRGYGVSDNAAPIHAALCACDSTVLLDEAHVTRAFGQTMRLIGRYRQREAGVPPLTFVEMTATPSGGVDDVFRLGEPDLSHPVLAARQKATKPATLETVDKRKFVARAADHALACVSESRQAIGVIVNRVQAARDIAAAIESSKDTPRGAEVHLVIGRMRLIDRDQLQEDLRKLIGPDRPETLDRPVFVVATQCLEVGADYDFDALVTESASIDALRQRFGRLNRRGRDVEAKGIILHQPLGAKDTDPVYGQAIQHTWDWLEENATDHNVNFGIDAFKALWEAVTDEARSAMLSPAPDAAILLPPHLDLLCQTAPRPVPDPDVSYFIHGPQRDMADVNVCWRADLGDKSSRWAEIVCLLPPTSPECMTVPLREVRRWMRGEKNAPRDDADVPITDADTPDEKQPREPKTVLVWRGRKQGASFDTDNASRLRPGDTIVLPLTAGGWDVLGHVRDAPPVAELHRQPDDSDDEGVKRYRKAVNRIDAAEQAVRTARRQVVVRLHPAFMTGGLAELPADELRDKLCEHLPVVPAGRIDRHDYPPADDSDQDDQDAPRHQVVVFRTPSEPDDKLELPEPPPVDEDEGDDDLSRVGMITLADHTGHVVEALDTTLAKLAPASATTFREAAKYHDLGKHDVRFQALLAGVTPYEAMFWPTKLGKGDHRPRSLAERLLLRERARLPDGFRHEMLSVELLAHASEPFAIDAAADRDLLLHLIASHHGHARPFAPVCIDTPADRDLLALDLDGHPIDAVKRQGFTPAHRLDSGVAERFWDLTRTHGWWGLAYIESILRLADQQASAMEQEKANRNHGVEP